VYIEKAPDRSSRPAILLRERWREYGTVEKRTIADLTDWPQAKLDALAAVLAGKAAVGNLEAAFDIVRSLLHGHVAAVLGTVTGLGLDGILSRARCRERDPLLP